MKAPPKITRMLTIFVEHGIMAHKSMTAKPTKTLALSNEPVFNNRK